MARSSLSIRLRLRQSGLCCSTQSLADLARLGLPIHLGPLPAVPRTASGSTPSTSSHKPSRSLASLARFRPKRPSTAPTSTASGPNPSHRGELEGRRIPSFSRLLPHSPRNERASTATSDRYDVPFSSLNAFHRLERLNTAKSSESETYSTTANGGGSPLRGVRGRNHHQSEGMTALSFLCPCHGDRLTATTWTESLAGYFDQKVPPRPTSSRLTRSTRSARPLHRASQKMSCLVQPMRGSRHHGIFLAGLRYPQTVRSDSTTTTTKR
jgi:hypothetical protein